MTGFSISDRNNFPVLCGRATSLTWPFFFCSLSLWLPTCLLMQLIQKLREFFSIGRIYTKHSKKSETFLLLMKSPVVYICELLLVCLTCQWSGYFLCPPKILENLVLTHAYSILTPLVSITNQMLNTGASQLPEEAAIQVNVFGEAPFGVLLRDINGIEVPGSVPMIFCIYPHVLLVGRFWDALERISSSAYAFWSSRPFLYR